MSIQDDFFEDLAVAFDSWVASSSDALTNTDANLIWIDKPEYFEKVRSALNQSGITSDDVKQVISEIISGVLVSMLTTIDGGTYLAEKNLIKLVDEQGQSLGSDLHNDFMLYLMETGRLE